MSQFYHILYAIFASVLTGSLPSSLLQFILKLFEWPAIGQDIFI